MLFEKIPVVIGNIYHLKRQSQDWKPQKTPCAICSKLTLKNQKDVHVVILVFLLFTRN